MTDCEPHTTTLHHNTHTTCMVCFVVIYSVSLQVFGFLNFVLWAGNIWFVFKETGWHKGGPARYAGAPPEKQAETFNQQQPYNQGSFDQSGGYSAQGDQEPVSEYSPVGGPTSYSNQM